jgi:ferredoxin
MPTIRFETSGKEVQFADGDEVNLLRTAIRNDCGVPYKCASGNCGTDRVYIEAGAEHLSRVRPKERDRLGDDVDKGFRLACQTYVSGDVTISWDPTRQGTDNERIKQKWLSGEAG